MEGVKQLTDLLDSGEYQSLGDDYLKLLLDNFRDRVEDGIQTLLMTELSLKYAQLSRDFEKKNDLLQQSEASLLQVQEQLRRYNLELHQLVDAKVHEISSSQLATIFALVKLSESRDDETGAHIERTAFQCRLLAQAVSQVAKYRDIVDQHLIDNIYKASPLHDIGKVGIPDRILLKPGKLTAEEFEIMKTHSLIGYRTLQEVQQAYPQNEFIRVGMEIAVGHHEKWNGSGYPFGIAGEDIPLAARIMALVDVYDALRSKRVYKEAFSHERSCQIIQEGRGTHFDPQLVDIFLQHGEQFAQVYADLIGK